MASTALAATIIAALTRPTRLHFLDADRYSVRKQRHYIDLDADRRSRLATVLFIASVKLCIGGGERFSPVSRQETHTVSVTQVIIILILFLNFSLTTKIVYTRTAAAMMWLVKVVAQPFLILAGIVFTRDTP
jgi:hypothetical protein